jgi:outer membrane biosynthesis protein TonB
MTKTFELIDNMPIKFKIKDENKKSILSDSDQEIKKGYSLIGEVDATHAGTLINNRIYPPEMMKKGIRTWTSPYKKPVLVNHDDTKDPIGRVISAKYFSTQNGTDLKEYKPILRESEGYGYQRLTIKVTDQEAIQKILDGRYETVSVRMSTDHCFCSVCNSDWSGEDGPCEHTPGTKYDGKLAYITTGDLNYRELSFVNIPADEYAGVKEAIISEQKDAAEVSIYANNDSEKVLADLSNGSNLYALIDSDAEKSDDIVTYLLDKSNKSKKIDKEEDVKLTELTREQLQDSDLFKQMVQEELDKAKAEAKKECEGAAKDCEAKMKKMKDEYELALEDAKKKKEDPKEEKKEEEKEEEEDAKEKKEEKKEDPKEEEKEEEDPKKKKKEEEEEEEEEDAKKKKNAKGAPVPNALPENKGSGKTGGVKHGAGNQGPVGEDPGDAVETTDRVKELEDANKKVLDENVKINSELHKMVAERLYDLKKVLRKPDVVGISTPDARNAKVEEYAQRSVDSLKDQIKDLLIEQETALATGLSGQDVENPAISQSDLTNEVMEDKKKAREGKQDTLTRLFPKSK